MGHWQRHKTKLEKAIRRGKYILLREAGYCVTAAKRARDFTSNKVRSLCITFSKDFNTFYKHHT